MNKQLFNANQVYGFLPTGINGINDLAELALDMRWSWNHSADKLWQQLDPALWKLTHNPWVVLQTVSYDHLKHLVADPVFREMIDELIKTREVKYSTPGWFQKNHPASSLTCLAYFTMEFMLSEASLQR